MTIRKSKPVDLKILVGAALISGVLFISGFLAGYIFSREGLGMIDTELDSIVRDVQDFQFQFLFFDILGDEAACTLLDSTLIDINRDAYVLGNRLSGYGPGREITDFEMFMNLKREYARMLVNYWLLSEKMKQSCDSNKTTVLYMFSEFCEGCENQGFVLNYIKGKYNKDILIFAVDGELDEAPIRAIRKFYGIETFPSMIIDGEMFQGFVSKERLESILDAN